ncbi:NAD(P)-binding protein [Stipitochalara longipes BDJ]|nr:NAD(P)-binding protein [Stipitochalara longipes BDJ]
MSTKKTIAVVGATGKQGGSVADTFLGLKNWHVRAITRNPSSEAAQALSAKGAEVVRADLGDPASLATAFANVNAIFLNTNYFEVFFREKAILEAEGKDIAAASQTAFEAETTWGKNAADAAAATPTLERIVFSILPSAVVNGKKTRSLHSETKAWTAAYIEREHPALAKKLSLIFPGAYNTNQLYVPIPDQASGKYNFYVPVLPEKHMPIIDPTKSVGPFVRVLIEDEPPGVKLLAYDNDSNLTIAEAVEAWSRATGKEGVLVTVTTDFAHSLGTPWEFLDVVNVVNEHDYIGLHPEGIIHPSQLKTKVHTKSFEQWSKENN